MFDPKNIQSEYLQKLADKIDLEIVGCRFSDIHLTDGDSILCFTLQSKDGRFRECSIKRNETFNLYEIRSNDIIIAMVNLEGDEK